MQKIIIGLKVFKLKFKKEKRKKGKFPELQKPKIEAEFYNKNKKYD